MFRVRIKFHLLAYNDPLLLARLNKPLACSSETSRKSRSESGIASDYLFVNIPSLSLFYYSIEQ
jgi:hypothetical protein